MFFQVQGDCVKTELKLLFFFSVPECLTTLTYYCSVTNLVTFSSYRVTYIQLFVIHVSAQVGMSRQC
jgi:hypothetical protein